MAEQEFGAMLDDLDARLVSAEPIAVGAAAEHVRGVSAGLTPVRDGFLVGSGGVTVEGNEAKVTYAGPYARNQHYSLDFRHTKGQALYLEQPMITETEKCMQIMADRLGKAF